MKYALKNLSALIRKERIVFAMMFVSVFFSALLLNFSYGVYRNYHTKTTEAEINNTMLRPRIADGQTLTKKDLQAYSEALSQELLDQMEVICAETVPEDGPGADMGGTFKMRYRMLKWLERRVEQLAPAGFGKTADVIPVVRGLIDEYAMECMRKRK